MVAGKEGEKEGLVAYLRGPLLRLPPDLFPVVLGYPPLPPPDFPEPPDLPEPPDFPPPLFFAICITSSRSRVVGVILNGPHPILVAMQIDARLLVPPADLVGMPLDGSLTDSKALRDLWHGKAPLVDQVGYHGFHGTQRCPLAQYSEWDHLRARDTRLSLAANVHFASRAGRHLHSGRQPRVKFQVSLLRVRLSRHLAPTDTGQGSVVGLQSFSSQKPKCLKLGVLQLEHRPVEREDGWLCPDLLGLVGIPLLLDPRLDTGEFGMVAHGAEVSPSVCVVATSN